MLYSLFQILGFVWFKPSYTLNVNFKGQSADLNTKHFEGIIPTTKMLGSIGSGVGSIFSNEYLPSSDRIFYKTSFFLSN